MLDAANNIIQYNLWLLNHFQITPLLFLSACQKRFQFTNIVIG